MAIQFRPSSGESGKQKQQLEAAMQALLTITAKNLGAKVTQKEQDKAAENILTAARKTPNSLPAKGDSK